MKKVVITGASGMIGSLVLNLCLERPDVSEVISLVRRPTGQSHPKLTEVGHTNWLDFTAVEEVLRNVDACFFCIGVYTGAVPAAEFTTITVDYTKAFADALVRQSPQASFTFLSGQGADTSEKSSILFARTKGIAENHLLRAGFSRVHLMRPGYIYPVTPRKEPNLAYAAFRVVWPLARAIYPNFGVASDQLARKMVQVGLDGSTQTIFENRDLRK